MDILSARKKSFVTFKKSSQDREALYGLKCPEKYIFRAADVFMNSGYGSLENVGIFPRL